MCCYQTEALQLIVIFVILLLFIVVVVIINIIILANNYKDIFNAINYLKKSCIHCKNIARVKSNIPCQH